ncbi:MAG: AAA family ATPase [Planctomycetaceae bacterium]|nr:AAA family ATPase [Planctomycetaceae bacterium]
MSDLNYPPLISGLLKPAAYPHQVKEVRVRQTHISWVLLTGEFAYKIKKPVNLGFLDFSTLDQRRHFCEEELRLNGRYSEDLYLDVVPIVQTREGPQVAGSGAPIEYAVRMRQFDERELATNLLKEGKLSSTLCNEVAAMVARMHGSAERVLGNEWGTPEKVAKPVAENFTELRPLVSEPERLRQIDELEVWSRDAADRLTSTFEIRQKQGFVRECHGDLHLGNIVRWQDAMTPFDCIEFNAAFRWIDVLNEVAFLVMDLDDHRRSDLGTRFLNSYLEQTGDYESLSVLPFYLTYRAVIRAKVHTIRANQPGLPSTESARLREECHSYLNLAQRYTRQIPGSLTITYGVSGSGKTTGSHQILNRQRSIHIRSDVERKRLFGLRSQDHATAKVGKGIYTSENNADTYDRLLSLSRSVLTSGFPVIVDASFLRRAERERFRKLAEQLSVPFQILPFHADIQTLRDRIQTRLESTQDASDATIAVLEHQLQINEPLTTDEQRFVISPAEPGRERESKIDS